MAPLKFAAFSSELELPFYMSLANLKINHDKLDDSARRVLGLYDIQPSQSGQFNCRLQIHGSSLTSEDVPAEFYRAEGLIRNMNTIEDYRNLDKTAVLTRAGRTVWDAIKDGSIFECPSLLASFSAICFADLKKYKFTYMFAFPALHSEPAWQIEEEPAEDMIDTGSPRFGPGTSDRSRTTLTSDEASALVEQVQTWRYKVDSRQYGFFLAKKSRVRSPGHSRRSSNSSPVRQSPRTPQSPVAFKWEIESLSAYEKGFFDGSHVQDRFICFADPSTYAEYPGWMLRNLLALVLYRWQLDKLQVLCYRDTRARRHEARSKIIRIKLDKSSTAASGQGIAMGQEMPKVTGWERNVAGKVASKVANLGEYMDPSRLADQAVDLNLKLMKWRIAPSLDLAAVKNARCLLLGAGTLGSYVARNLLGWGVRTITFVDNGSVSFSNPVRQPLFGYKDCLDGGVKKATRAAEALQEIYPGVASAGHDLSVPMAGHPITDADKIKADFDRLKRLIEDHDVVFLLMDSRESRWLPTVMGKAHGKIVVNAALGFDSFVVMRHGIRNVAEPSSELGCYFCNDVVAPADVFAALARADLQADDFAVNVRSYSRSAMHRHTTSDQTAIPLLRPGQAETSEHPLGQVPHQIRGFLATFQNIVVSGKSYDCCSACSPKILDAYLSQGWEFVQRALNEKGYVEQLSGLAEVQRAAEAAAANVDWEEESGEGSDMDDF